MPLLFHPRLQGLAAFLDNFNSRKEDLMFAADAQGIYVAAWTAPWADIASFSCWVRADKRRARETWRELQTAYTVALEVYPALIGATRQAALHSAHLRMGYEYRGKLVNALKDGPVYLYELSRAGWGGRRVTAQILRAKRRNQRTASEVGTNHDTNGDGEYGQDGDELERQPWVQRQLARFGLGN